MFLRKLRWLAAGVLTFGAVLGTASESRADISVLVQEIDSSGNVVQTAGTFSSAAGATNYNFATSTNSFNVTNFSTSLFSNGAFGSLSSTFNLQIGSGFTTAPGDGLLFTVTATGASNSFAGQPGAFTNNAGASSGISGTGGLNNIAGINYVSGTTTVGSVTTAASISEIGDGSTSFPPAGTTTGNVANLPNPYSITQTITVYALPVNSSAQISAGATFGGTASSTVTSNAAPVPAPGGLALALMALPVLGLRRTLRRKAVAEVI